MRSWRTSCQRLAPSDNRIPISRCREAARAVNKPSDVGARNQEHQSNHAHQRDELIPAVAAPALPSARAGVKNHFTSKKCGLFFVVPASEQRQFVTKQRAEGGL